MRVGRETKGRKGKGVTVITGLPLNDVEIKRLARQLKQKCGSGGTVKDRVIEKSRAGEVKVFTDAVASPTGFPFKVVELEDSMSDQSVYEKRERICDLGYLRHGYERENGTIGWRCPSEPVDDYLAKGGELSETIGRKCLCNSLLSNVDLPQVTPRGEREGMLITSGDDAAYVARFAPEGSTEYAAADVIEYLLSDIVAPVAV